MHFTSAGRSPDRARIEVGGEIDLATVNKLRNAVTKAINDGAHTVELVLDQVTYIDSAGLGTLIGAHRRLSALGGELVVQCSSERVLRLFRLTGLDQVLQIRDRADAAPDPEGEAAPA